MKRVRGFTLMELIMVITILSIVSLIVGQMMWNGFYVYLNNKQNLNFAEQAQTLVARINRDLNSARSIQTAAVNQLVFTDSNGNSVDYHLNGSILMRNTQPLAENINNITFSYFDNNGAATGALNQIYYLTTWVVFTQNGTSFNLQTTLHPRNI